MNTTTRKMIRPPESKRIHIGSKKEVIRITCIGYDKYEVIYIDNSRQIMSKAEKNQLIGALRI